jgi:hypothetical protein
MAADLGKVNHEQPRSHGTRLRRGQRRHAAREQREHARIIARTRREYRLSRTVRLAAEGRVTLPLLALLIQFE